MSCRIGLLVAVLAIGGCASSQGGDEDLISESGGGKSIKVSYIRFNKDPSGRFIMEYRLMLSDGWKLFYGKNSREPFGKLCRYPFTSESVPDAVLQQLVDEMERHGLGELVSTTIPAINLGQLRAVQQARSEETAARWRIINIETDTMKKTVTYSDNDDRPTGGARFETFQKVEREVLKVAVQWTVQASVEALEGPPPRFRK